MSHVTGKRALRLLLLSYPKNDSRQSFFGYDTNYKDVPCCLQDYILACQSFFWYDTDKHLKAHFPMTQVTYAFISGHARSIPNADQ